MCGSFLRSVGGPRLEEGPIIISISRQKKKRQEERKSISFMIANAAVVVCVPNCLFLDIFFGKSLH